MLPVGITLLSIDYPRLRRPRRRMVVWGGRKLKALLARYGVKAVRQTPAAQAAVSRSIVSSDMSKLA
jgi:hypothetical protein